MIYWCSQSDPGAGVWAGVNIEASSNVAQPFLHTEESEAGVFFASGSEPGGLESDAVILDGDEYGPLHALRRL